MTDEVIGDSGYQIQRRQLQRQRQQQELQQQQRPFSAPGAELPGKATSVQAQPRFRSGAGRIAARRRSVAHERNSTARHDSAVSIATEARSVANRSQNELLIRLHQVMGDLPCHLAGVRAAELSCSAPTRIRVSATPALIAWRIRRTTGWYCAISASATLPKDLARVSTNGTYAQI